MHRPITGALMAASLALAAVVLSAIGVQAGPAPAGRFAGKFELVVLFGSAHRPVIANGHAEYAERNQISFRTDAGEVVTVFSGDVTDLASIPRLVWPLLPPDGPWAEAAAFHDRCYKSQGTFVFHGHLGRTRPAAYDRAGCDGILLEAMTVLGVPPWKRALIYWAVRAGGAAGWGR